MSRLSGRIAVITGAASGIGRAAAILFAAEGAAVLIADRAEGVAETAEQIAVAGGRAVALIGDAGEEAFVRTLVERAQSELGGLDVFWANAGVSGGVSAIAEQTPDQWAELLRVNLIGPFLAVKHASAAMVPMGRGSIICTASVAGLKSGASGAPYAASKAGVISLVQLAANELYGTGVRVNAVCPGLIETGMTRPIFEGARARGSEHKLGQLNPLLRPGQPEEVAEAGLFLASDEASYVNGHALVVDGGLTSSMPVVGRRKV